ncbi:MAG: GAF domain-containing protein [Anaerolineales bacterium]|nr:GAF domain-containing protein [Anaerolineales bacterium]
MTTLRTPVNPFLLPTGEFQTPVCLGDMPLHRYQVPIYTRTETVTSYLDVHPEIPGVILTDRGKLHSVITRSRMFERLGHRYGVELFLRKPIIELQMNLGVSAYPVSSNTRIQDAVQIALKRSPDDVYDPFVVIFDNDDMGLLDIHVLLLAQSHTLQNANNIMGNLARIEQAIRSDAPLDHILDFSLKSLQKVVPFHSAAIHVQELEVLHGLHGSIYPFNRSLYPNDILQAVLNIRQTMQLDDVTSVPAWDSSAPFHEVRSWVGAPLLKQPQAFGVLSVMRHSHSPFSKNEMNVTSAFAELMSKAICNVPVNTVPHSVQWKKQ